MRKKKEVAEAEQGTRFNTLSNFQLLAIQLQFIAVSVGYIYHVAYQNITILLANAQLIHLFYYIPIFFLTFILFPLFAIIQFQSKLQQKILIYYILHAVGGIMDSEMIRLMAAEVPPHHNILKQLDPQQKRQVFQASQQRHTIIIDYGSQTIKAGFEPFPNPNIVFRPQISKTRDPNKTEQPIKSIINLSYDQLDITKANYKSPYQKNIILHFSVLEQCNDYIFSQILKPGKKSQSSFIISQPFANPIHCRNSILGQLFDCYQVGQVFVGVDALFAYFYQLGCDLGRYNTETSLVVDVGANTIHVFAVVQGKVQFGSVRRINVGGNNAFQLFARTLILKNPQLKSKLTYTFLRDLYQTYTSIAYNYKDQLHYFEQKITSKRNIKQPIDNTIYHNLSHQHSRGIIESNYFVELVQIDFDVIVEIPEEEIRRKEEMKVRMAEKLRETIQRRKEIKRKMHEHELKQLMELKQKYDNGDKSAHEEVVEMFGPAKCFDKLIKKIHSLQVKLGMAEQKPEQNKFSLIQIPDHELTSQKLKLKRIQIYQKGMIEAKKRKQQQKQMEEQKMKDLRENNPQVYLQQLKEKYKLLSEKAKENQRVKNQLNSRKSRLKQKRMQVLARLAEEDYNEDNVENQEDMQILKDPEESDHYSELQVMEAELREIDPEWNNVKKDIHHLNSSNQLFLSVDLVKCHEIYFEPRIVGCQQAGLIETIIASIEQFSSQIRSQLLSNIILIGGGSTVSGFKGRIEKDLTRETPTGSKINVKIGKGGHLGAYLGMQNIARMPKLQTAQYFYQRSEFRQLQNNEYLESPWSNPKPNINIM